MTLRHLITAILLIGGLVISTVALVDQFRNPETQSTVPVDVGVVDNTAGSSLEHIINGGDE